MKRVLSELSPEELRGLEVKLKKVGKRAAALNGGELSGSMPVGIASAWFGARELRCRTLDGIVLPLMVLTPSKPRLIFTRIVGIKVDVQPRYSAISKLEDVAETAARMFPLPTTYQTFCPVKCLQRRDSRLKE